MGICIKKNNSMTERFNNPDSKQIDMITMKELENFYTTSVCLDDGTVIDAKMPYLVCMAIHGNLDGIVRLLKRYPLMGSDGWSDSLVLKESIEKVYLFTRFAVNGEFFVNKYHKKVTVIVALGLSGKLKAGEQFDVYYRWNGISRDDLRCIDELYPDKKRELFETEINRSNEKQVLLDEFSKKRKGE